MYGFNSLESAEPVGPESQGPKGTSQSRIHIVSLVFHVILPGIDMRMCAGRNAVHSVHEC